jgi:hypothetical protein
MKKILVLIISIAIGLSGCSKNGPSFDQLSQSLKNWLAEPRTERVPLEDLNFSRKPLTKVEAEKITQLLFQDHQNQIKNDFEKQWEEREIEYNGMQMPFFSRNLAKCPVTEEACLYPCMVAEIQGLK